MTINLWNVLKRIRKKLRTIDKTPEQPIGMHPALIITVHTENQPHKQHIWFFADTLANAKKTKRAVFSQRLKIANEENS